MSKKVLTKEEKQQKKLENKYKIFRNKILAIIGAVLFVVGFVLPCVVIGAENVAVTMFASIGAILMIITSFLIFRKPALSLMLVGAGLVDLSFIANTMDSSDIFSIGLFLSIFGLICFMIGEKSKDRRKANHAIKLEYDFVKELSLNDPDYVLADALVYASQRETIYKAKLHLTAAIISVLTCGIGLVLPFGVKALRYCKAAAFITSSPELIEDKKYNENKPFKDYTYSGVICMEGKRFKIKSPYITMAAIGMLSGYGYVIISEILSVILRKGSVLKENETTLGSVVFSANMIADIDAEATSILVNYSKHQSAETRQELIDGLKELSDDIDSSLKREGERIARYEQERDRAASYAATGASVKTDGKDYYVEGTYEGGVEGVKKLDNYDHTTGVGEYTDETGKKVKIKNTNKK